MQFIQNEKNDISILYICFNNMLMQSVSEL